MKLSVISSILLSVFATSQALQIGSPANGSVIVREESVVVQVIQTDSTEDISTIRIGLFHGNTLPPLNLGDILFDGPYTPTYHEGSEDLYENFTVTVPINFASGGALLSAAPEFTLPTSPLIDVTSISVTVSELLPLPNPKRF